MSTPTGGTRPGLAIALSVVGFGALGICGLGLLSLATDTDVIAVDGLSAVPGAVGFAAALVAVAVCLAVALRSPHPSYLVAAVAAPAAVLAYLCGLAVAGVLVGADLSRIGAAIGGFAVSWFAAVLAAAAAVSAWVGVALVRTRAHPPHWRWESGDEQ